MQFIIFYLYFNGIVLWDPILYAQPCKYLKFLLDGLMMVKKD